MFRLIKGSQNAGLAQIAPGSSQNDLFARLGRLPTPPARAVLQGSQSVVFSPKVTRTRVLDLFTTFLSNELSRVT